MSPQDRVQVLSKNVKEQRQRPITAIAAVSPEVTSDFQALALRKKVFPAYLNSIYILGDLNVKKRPPILRKEDHLNTCEQRILNIAVCYEVCFGSLKRKGCLYPSWHSHASRFCKALRVSL